MPSEVQNAGGKYNNIGKGQNRLVFRNPRGNKRFYAVYDEIDFAKLAYEWSSNGTTWTNAQVIIEDTSVLNAFDVKIQDDGSQLVVYIIWHDSSLTSYRRGTISDASDTISFSATQTIDAAISDILAGPQCIAIARTANGRLVVAFTEDITVKGKQYRQTKLIGSNGDGAAPTWSGETIWDDPSGSANNDDKNQVWFGLESMSGDRVLLYTRIPDATSTTVYKATTAAPTWNGTSFANTTQGNVLTNNANHGKILSGLVDADNRAHLIAFDFREQR